MPLKLKTAPAADVLTVADLQEHCIVDSDDAAHYLESLIAAITDYVDGDDGILGRALINQTWYYYRHAWPSGDRFEIPLSPLVSVASVTYKDTTGAVATWDAANYIVDTASEPGQIVLAYGCSWPSTTLYPSNPITVEFTAGYGADASSVPEDLKLYMKAACAYFYGRRDSVAAGQVTQLAQELPLFGSLMQKYRVRCNRES